MKLIAPVAVAALLLGFGGSAWADVEIRTSNTTEHVRVSTGDAVLTHNGDNVSSQVTGAEVAGSVAASAPEESSEEPETVDRTTSSAEGSGAGSERDTFEPASERIVAEIFVGV